MEASIQGNSSTKEKLRFDRVEFGGSLGDRGTLVPIVVAMILISKLSPTGVSPCLGLFCLLAGSSYRLPALVLHLEVVGAIACLPRSDHRVCERRLANHFQRHSPHTANLCTLRFNFMTVATKDQRLMNEKESTIPDPSCKPLTPGTRTTSTVIRK